MSAGDDMDGDGGDRILAAEHVLGLLPEAERATFAARLRTDAGLRAEVAFWQHRLSAFDREFSDVTPPARLLAAIEARAFGTAARSGWWNSLALWRSFAGAAAMVAVVAVGFALTRPASLDATAVATQLIAAIEQEGSDVKFLALYDGATGQVKLTAMSGDPGPDRDFELWYVEGDQAPVSMGVIPVSQGPMAMPLAPDARIHFTDGTVLAISLEPKGGSPTGSPTQVVAAGPAVPI